MASAIVYAVVIHINARKEKVETGPRCLADVEMFQLVLVKACRTTGSNVWVSFLCGSISVKKTRTLNSSWNPDTFITVENWEEPDYKAMIQNCALLKLTETIIHTSFSNTKNFVNRIEE